MGYKVSSEYKEHKSGKYKYKRVKFNGRFYGELRLFKGSKRPFYLAARLPTEGLSSRGGAFALDASLDGLLRLYGCRVLGVAITKSYKTRSIDPKNVLTYYFITFDNYVKYRREEKWGIVHGSVASGRARTVQNIIDTVYMTEVDVSSECDRVNVQVGLLR